MKAAQGSIGACCEDALWMLVGERILPTIRGTSMMLASPWYNNFIAFVLGILREETVLPAKVFSHKSNAGRSPIQD